MRALALRTVAGPILVILATLALVAGSAALRVGAADHLDAPSLGSLLAGAVKGDRDVNDVYVFGVAGNRTVLAMTTHPAVNTPINAFKTYATNVRYVINVDRNGDFVQDLAYVITFKRPNANGDQGYTVTRYTGRDARTLEDGSKRGRGSTAGNGMTTLKSNGIAFAGERSDPFFFDLIGFRGTLGLDTATTQRLCDVDPDPDPDGTGQDFFANLNTMAIVLELPDGELGGKIGVWADTRERVSRGGGDDDDDDDDGDDDGDDDDDDNRGRWTLVDQMGRPAINTVFNSGAAKESFNVTPPSVQDDAGQPYRGNVSSVLQALSAGDLEGPYAADQAGALAGVLIPDVITYDTASTSTNILNGRALSDDVIDVELNITTGGDPFDLFGNRDATGAIPSDCVEAHTDYLASFPYLGNPH